MKGKWKVSSNYLGGGVVYQVYRTLREGEVDHCGNREYFPGAVRHQSDGAGNGGSPECCRRVQERSARLKFTNSKVKN